MYLFAGLGGLSQPDTSEVLTRQEGLLHVNITCNSSLLYSRRKVHYVEIYPCKVILYDIMRVIDLPDYDDSRMVAFASTENIHEYFRRYIMHIVGKAESTYRHYRQGLQTISKYMKEMGLVKESIYELGSIEQLDFAWKMLNTNETFVALDSRGHHMYSAGYRHYHKFAAGERFRSIGQKEIMKLDVPVVCEEPVTMEYKIWKRSGILRNQTIEFAGYQCEIDHGHDTFIAESTNQPYMEAHHIIPLRQQENFGNSLDVYANLISLCPICHRKIHLGLRDERRSMVDELYEKRKERLANCGLIMGKEEFEDVVLSD